MRILRVAQNLYPEVPGGGTYHVHAMSRDQAAMGHDVTVLTVSGDTSLPRREKRDGYTVVRHPPTIELLNNEISVGMIRSLRDARDFDVVHAHSHLYFSTNIAAVLRCFGEVPLAITNHGLYSQNAPEWLFGLYLRTAGRWTFNRADVVFCYTEEDMERVRDLGVDSRIKVVSNGVDMDRFTPEGRESDLIEHDGPALLFVGRLVDGKRPRDAIEAVMGLPEKTNAKLFMVGDGPLREELELLADREIVEFLEQLPYEEMPAVYRAGDLLLLPSRTEGLPRTILEAMASGLPVVTSNLDQFVPIVDGGGVTVPVGDVEGFADGIKSVLDGEYDDPRSLVEDSFDWKATVRQTTTVLSELGANTTSTRRPN